MLASGGALIRDHIDSGHLQRILATQHFDVVVLQELGGFPLCAADFHGCADSPRALKEAVAFVRIAGARPILYGTWQPDPNLQPELSRAAREIATDLDADFADIGGAIHGVNDTKTPMLDAKGHPSPAGSWLAALVLVKAITMHDLPPTAPSPICEPDWTGTGPSEDSLASTQPQPPTRCFSLTKDLSKELQRVANQS